jgi:sortase B
MKAKILTAALLLLAAFGVFCGHRYYENVHLPEKHREEAVKKQAEIIESIRPDTGVKPVGTGEALSDPLVLCENVNDDIVGWINIPDTKIDLPIVQGEDNDFYLHNGVDGQYNYELGCPFLDYRCEAGFTGLNSIVYAHNMEGQLMFSDIDRYKEKEFMQSHPAGILTLKDGEHNVRFFAYMTAKSTAPAYHAVFVSESEKKEYLEYILSAANYTVLDDTDEIRDKTDLNLLLLTTCTFEFEEARGILFGIIER